MVSGAEYLTPVIELPVTIGPQTKTVKFKESENYEKYVAFNYETDPDSAPPCSATSPYYDIEPQTSVGSYNITLNLTVKNNILLKNDLKIQSKIHKVKKQMRNYLQGKFKF